MPATLPNTTLMHHLAVELQPLMLELNHHLVDIGSIVCVYENDNAHHPNWANADTAVFDAYRSIPPRVTSNTTYETVYKTLAYARTAMAVTKLAIQHEPGAVPADKLKELEDNLVAIKTRIGEIDAAIDAAIA